MGVEALVIGAIVAAAAGGGYAAARHNRPGMPGTTARFPRSEPRHRTSPRGEPGGGPKQRRPGGGGGATILSSPLGVSGQAASGGRRLLGE